MRSLQASGSRVLGVERSRAHKGRRECLNVLRPCYATVLVLKARFCDVAVSCLQVDWGAEAMLRFLAGEAPCVICHCIGRHGGFGGRTYYVRGSGGGAMATCARWVRAAPSCSTSRLPQRNVDRHALATPEATRVSPHVLAGVALEPLCGAPLRTTSMLPAPGLPTDSREVHALRGPSRERATYTPQRTQRRGSKSGCNTTCACPTKVIGSEAARIKNRACQQLSGAQGGGCEFFAMRHAMQEFGARARFASRANLNLGSWSIAHNPRSARGYDDFERRCFPSRRRRPVRRRG